MPLTVKDTAAPGVYLICDGSDVLATVHRGGREFAHMIAAARLVVEALELGLHWIEGEDRTMALVALAKARGDA